MPHAFGVEDDRHAVFECVDNMVDPTQRPGLVVGRRADRAPRIEDLKCVGTGIDLHVEVVDDRIGQFLHELLEKRGLIPGELLDG